MKRVAIIPSLHHHPVELLRHDVRWQANTSFRGPPLGLLSNWWQASFFESVDGNDALRAELPSTPGVFSGSAYGRTEVNWHTWQRQYYSPEHTEAEPDI